MEKSDSYFLVARSITWRTIAIKHDEHAKYELLYERTLKVG